MDYNVNDKGNQVCAYCGKKNLIYKLGYCKPCYTLILRDKYVLKPNSKFRVDSEEEMIMYFLNHPEISKKALAKKFKVAISTVYYNIKKYTEKIKVES